MNCPLCTDQQLQVTHRVGVEIDICPQCRGIWLDRGELDRLAEAATRPAQASSGAQHRDPVSHDDVDDDSRQDESGVERRSRKRSKKRRLADRLGDVLEEVLDL
jgi:Zn-finger nucleic acid-binding protein